MTRHCFHVASSCILPSIMCTPRPSGMASITFRANATSSGSGGQTFFAAAVWTGGGHPGRAGREHLLRDVALNGVQRPRADAAQEERGAELGLAPGDVADVPERPVEGEDPGPRARIDHAPERVVPEVLLRARARRLGIGGVRVAQHAVARVAAADA